MSRSQIRRGARPEGLGTDDTGCTILHVDMDAFYASVELRHRPELRGRPMVVGGGGGRSIVLAATYEARHYGIHSAMPMSRARRLCSDLVVVPPDHRRYAEVSTGVMRLFASITPLVEPLSLDEAFLDVSGAVRRMGSPAVIGEQLRARVHDEQGITCSVGVATTKFVAKMASTQAKPDGLLVIPRDDVIAFLHPMPVDSLWGVGERTEEVLQRLGLRTIGDIANTPESTLRRALGEALGAHLYALSWGRDPRSVSPHEPEKSIGNEHTFAADVDDPMVVRRELLRLSEQVARRLREAGVVGRTVSIKVRFADFTTITRSRTLPEPTDVGRELYSTALRLYDALALQRARLRLVGVRVEGLLNADSAPEQLLLDAPDHGWRDAERAADVATRRFGRGAVVPASLVDPHRIADQSEPSSPPERD